MNTSSFSHNQNQTKCGNGYLSSLLLLLWVQLRSQFSLLILHVRRVVLAGPVAFNEIVSNTRILAGLGLGTVGVYALYIHLLFNETARDYSWYYVNAFYFMFTIRWYVTIICFSGMWALIAPSKYKVLWLLFAFSSAIGFAGLLHHTFSVDSFETYHATPSWYVIIIAIASGIGFIKSVDYLCYRKYHLKDGNAARIRGIIKAPNIDAETKMRLLESLVKEQENYNARF
jgi:hypothetical protein